MAGAVTVTVTAVEVDLPITALAPGGEGVGEAGGRKVFVPFSAPGDRVRAEVTAGEGPAHAALLEVLAPGLSRVAPPCPHFGPAPGDRCGGCEWLHLDAAAQLAAKEAALVETLRRIGKLAPGSYALRPTLASPRPLRYRARAKFHLDRDHGALVFFRRRSHEGVVLRECHLLDSGLDALRAEVGPALAAAGVPAREVALEWSADERAGAVLLRLTGAGPSVRGRVERLLAAVPALRGAVLEAEGAAAVVVGDPVLRQARRPGDPTAGFQRSRPDVFLQANRGANALLVDAALALLGPDGARVLELYCGAGNFTAPLAARAAAVNAVEFQGPALELARADAGERPGGGALRFFAGDGLALARAFAREPSVGPRFDAVLLDPPREGARGIGPALRDLRAPRAVYVSCDPATFARDLRACVEAGYRIEVVQPVDLFPQTHHLEAVASLTRAPGA